ncbi:MAG: 50S ribosomal protein L18 [Candidatus Eisenbacteria bacterium]|uniref:Large ribosomal subunit protein uL18 n=1 Tax=Eiseniibacteriota bacterium TaxID=2212470 RepID=A0A538U0G5_UNCEI|nr:MAG: 50S ribosomal protein L18 [Candidatus Eisenbacteria bacterium]
MSGRHDKMELRHIRHLRIRKKIRGTGARPRLSVFRSSTHIYAQLVDDLQGVTLAAASSRDDLESRVEGKGRVAVSGAVGKLLAERAKAKGITVVAFDRGGFMYHGRVKALADGARAGGLEF